MALDAGPDGPAARREVLLAVLSGCSFVMPLSLFLLSPLLVDLSVEFEVTVAQAGQLMTFTALPSAILAILIGPTSDFFGRRPLLIGGTALLSLSSFAAAFAPSYELMMASRLLTGLGFACMGPSIFASVGDLFPYQERGRAYGWTVGANTLSMIIGIPLATILAAAVTWRLSFFLVGIATAIAAIFLAVLYRPAPFQPAESEAGRENGPALNGEGRGAALLRSYRDGYIAVLNTPTALAVMGSSFSMSVGLMALETYLGALLITRYGIGTGDLGPIMALGGLGVLVGSQIGGRLGDRIGHKLIMGESVLVAAVFVLLMAYAPVDIFVVAGLNFLRSVPMGMRFTAASAIISEAVPTARATMQAVNQSSFNVGVMGGAFLGGLVVENFGYAHVALMTVAGAVVSAGLIGLFVVEYQPASEEDEAAAEAASVPLVSGPV